MIGISQSKIQNPKIQNPKIPPLPQWYGQKETITGNNEIEEAEMIQTTTGTVQGAMVSEYLGIVTAEVVYGSNALRDFFAGIRDIIGGRTGAYERVFERGQREAIAELEQRAGRLGADAVIGVRVDTGTISLDESGVLLLITATGTAVKLAPQGRL